MTTDDLWLVYWLLVL